MRKYEAQLKHIVTMALMLNLGVAVVYAQQKPVKMTLSGTNVGTTIDLQPDTITDDVNLAGDGTLGPFTYHELHADTVTPQSSPTCVGGTGLYIPTLAGGAVFRFEGGSLLTVELTEGALCIDLTAGVARFTGSYKITGGTGRFKSASGTLTMTSTVSPVLFNASNAPALLTNTGEFTGTVSGVCREEDRQEEQQ